MSNKLMQEALRKDHHLSNSKKSESELATPLATPGKWRVTMPDTSFVVLTAKTWIEAVNIARASFGEGCVVDSLPIGQRLMRER